MFASLQTELKRNKSERLFAQAAGVIVSGASRKRTGRLLGKHLHQLRPRSRGVFARRKRAKRPEARLEIAFRTFQARAGLLSTIKDATRMEFYTPRTNVSRTRLKRVKLF